ncbi:hypothetical protein H8356DRAFT_1332811 [Neocallimastix lanati (nom. inval.)]|nr:hypothetical protein H8356DRAFT_1332811 [Neocallimastix sp. JGI-2020a]
MVFLNKAYLSHSFSICIHCIPTHNIAHYDVYRLVIDFDFYDDWVTNMKLFFVITVLLELPMNIANNKKNIIYHTKKHLLTDSNGKKDHQNNLIIAFKYKESK